MHAGHMTRCVIVVLASRSDSDYRATNPTRDRSRTVGAFRMGLCSDVRDVDVVCPAARCAEGGLIEFDFLKF